MESTVPHPTRTGVERLSEEVCWALLDSTDVARLAVREDDGVDVLPITYAVDGRRIVFRSTVGAMLRDLTITPSVTLEIDGWTSHDAWSVVVRGLATTVHPRDVGPLERLGLTPWSAERPSQWVSIEPDTVSGRRFLRPPR
jgi:nitroimidazol reductase NimA-like FMN-containing flavoprotein (pyridoxamine 5'-phosphate oxidase superfamily)